MSSKVASIATGTSGRPASRIFSVSRVRAKRVCSARSNRTCAKRRRERGSGDAPRRVEGHGHARIAVEQAAAVVDRVRVTDERVAALGHLHATVAGTNVDLYT